MNSFFEWLPKKMIFMAIGVLYSLLAPLGWILFSAFLSEDILSRLYLIYLILVNAFLFGFFGYVLGSSHDFLYRVLEKDNLTILLNQKAFYKYTQKLYSMGIRHRDKIALAMIDIDSFKLVNDKYNHLVGSQVLIELAKIIKENIRESDFAARFGGDEFIVCFARIEEEFAKRATERLREKIESHTFLTKEGSVKITVSIGVAFASCSQNLNLEKIIEAADKCLYAAKENGRNKVVLTYINPGVGS
jgi:diguanylate cyclase (GGDEF)-like protein